MIDAPTCDEIADGIYRLSTFVADLGPPAGMTVNQFLVLAEEPLLFHTGFRSMAAAVAAAVDRVVPLDRLRWISFGHVEADECGGMNALLGAAPNATVAFGALGCAVSIRDLADRPPHAVTDGDALDLGGRRVRFVATPHVPHNWEAQVLYEETTRTLLCGDLFTQAGRSRAIDDDVVTAALETQATLASAAPGPAVPAVLHRLTELAPETLATMHGASFVGDGASALDAFATGWEARFGAGIELSSRSAS